MSENVLNTAMLKAVLEEYATPDPKIVGTIPRNGVNLSYVSHADITRILIEIDPSWSWHPVAWVNGRPAINVENGIATMWATLTLLGKPMLGVGSVRADKFDLDKELVGDFLRNAAMRFGIALSLWSKQDWSDNATVTPIKRADHPARATLRVVQNEPEREPTPEEIAEMLGGTVVENESPVKPVMSRSKTVSERQKGLIGKLAEEKANGDVVPLMQKLFNKNAVDDLLSNEASVLINHLIEMPSE